ncbi:MAG: fibronectin type III domain-containing protein [Bacteroidales bacterium]|jgi:hypothetical protein|nr:fibronectin type III domain-containing protein [Bacteroidales bacterium]
MKKISFFLFVILLAEYLSAQNCNMPNNLSAVVNAHNSVSVSWNLNGRTRNAPSIELWNQADLVTHAGGGYNGADIAALYGDGNSYGFTSTAPSWYLADDFFLSERSVVTQMDFYAYQTGGVTSASSITGVYLAIFDQQPTNDATPIWGGDQVNRLDTSYWSGIYRVNSTITTHRDTTRPIMKMVANVNLDLPAGEYWVAVCFVGDANLGQVFTVPRIVTSELSTGNAMQYNPNDATNRWTALIMGQNEEQQGLPFTVRGFYVLDSVASFNIYRDGALLNAEPIGSYTYTDNTTEELGYYCYTVEALYMNGCVSGRSSDVCVNTPVSSCLIRNLPYSESFDQYFYGMGVFLPCWERYSFGTSTTLPYLSSTNSSSPASLYFPTANMLVLTPEISPDIDVRDLEVILKVYKSSASYSLDVGIVGEWHNNINDLTVVQNIASSAATSTWEEFTVPFSTYTGTDGKRIGFRAVGGAIYVDEVIIQYTPSCPVPTAMMVTSTTTTDATLSWTPGGTELSWNLEYRIVGEENWTMLNNLSSPSYTITGLSSSRNYSIETRVMAICSDDESFWAENRLNFATSCDIISDFPYFENFDSYTGINYNGSGGVTPVCWYSYTNNTTYPKPSVRTGSSYAYRVSEPNCLGFTNGTSGTGPKGTAILPEFQQALSTMTISFWTKMESTTNGVLHIGYVTNHNHDSTFVSLFTVPSNTATAGAWHEYFLNTYTFPTGARLAIQWLNTTGSYYSCCIDDLTINLIPTCTPPTNITATNIQPNNATITWTPMVGETIWNFSYKNQDSTEWNYVYNLTSASHVITGLDYGSFYDVRVMAVCSDDNPSRWSDTYTFVTTCNPISTFPATFTFDNHGTGSNAFDWCWSKAGTIYHQIVHVSSPASLYMYSSSTATAYAVMPRIDDAVSLSSLQLSFMLLKTSAASGVTVGVMTDPDSVNTFTAIATVSPSAVSIWEVFDVSLATYAGTGKYIAFRLGTGSAYMDDLIVDYIPTCNRIASANISHVSGQDVQINWTQETDATYSITYQSMNDEGWTVLENVTPPYTLTDLLNNTVYYLKIVAHCSTGTDLASNPQSFMLPCGDIEELPYVETFDSYGTGTGTFPTCWSRYYSGSTTTYPYITSTNSSSPGSLYMYAGSASYCIMAISPQISSEINLNDLEFSFKARKATATHAIQVGMISDPTKGDTTFTLLATITPDNTSEWQTFTISLSNYTDTARRIAFRSAAVGTNTSNTLYVDDFRLDYITTCFVPDSITVSDISQTEATLSWNNPGNVDSWNIEFLTTGESNFTLVENHPDNTIIIDTLTPGVSYEFRVQAVCTDGFSSRWSNLQSFAAYCNSITLLPYRESFDTYGTGTAAFPTCWRKGGTATIYINATNNTAPGSLYLSSTSSTSGIACSPEFDIPLNELQLTLKVRNTSAAYTLEVGFMNSPSEFDTYEPYTTLTPSATSTWEEFTVYFDRYAGIKKCIAFKTNGLERGATNTVYADDMVVDYLPECVPPVGPYTYQVGSSSVYIDWLGLTDNMTSWQLVYGKTSESLDTIAPVIITEKPYFLENLDIESDYQFKIMSNCDDGSNSQYSTVTRFTTLCGPITEVPYYENFDTYGVGTAFFPDCWITNTNHTAKAYVNSTNLTAPGGLYMYTLANTYKIFISQEIEIPINELQFEFAMKTSAANDVLIGVMDDPLDTSTFQLIQAITPRTTYWNQYAVAFSNYTGTGKHIAVRTGSGVANTYYMDNFKIDYAPSCVAPTGLSAFDVEHTSATFVWPAVTGATYSVVWGPAGFNPNVDYPATTTDENRLEVDGMEHSTNYEYYVKSHCDDGTSNWSIAYAFKTKCMDITVPYTEDFDSWGYGTATYPIPNCWTKLSTYNVIYPYLNATYKYSGVASLLLYNTTGSTYTAAVLPQLDAAVNIQDLTISFKMYSISATSGVAVGVIADLNDFSTFREIGRQLQGTASTWVDVEIDLASYADTGRYVALYVLGASAIYVDDLILENTPTCKRFAGLAASQATHNSVQLSWVDDVNDNPVRYEIEYGEAGFTQGEGTVVSATGSPYTLSGLQEGTNYEFYVRAICTEGDEGVWSRDAGTFTTFCISLTTTPYTENFDFYSIPTSSYLTEGILPSCWYGTSSTSPAPHMINSGSYYYMQSSPNSLSFSATTANPYAYAVLPQLDTAVQLSKITFYYQYQNATYGKLSVGYITGNQSDMSTFNEVLEIPAHTGTMTSATIAMTDYLVPENATHIVFRYYQNSGASSTTRYSCCVDDISVVGLDPALLSDPDTCHQPINLIVDNITTNSAHISWMRGGDSEIGWILEYKKSTDTAYISTTPTTMDTTLSINPGTTYNVRVKAVCDVDFESEYTMTSFTTSDSIRTYTITPEAGANGSISPNILVVVQEGGSAQFDITPDETYIIRTIYVNGDSVTIANPYVFNNVRQNYTIRAEFQKENSVLDYDNNNVNIYPNPAKDYLIVELTNLFDEIEIFNLFGQVIYKDKITESTFKINVGSFSSGVYVIKISNAGGMVIKKFVKK